MALKYSKQLLSVHLSGNCIDYYEKIYIRQMLKATVQQTFTNFADKLTITSKDEQLQLNTLADRFH